MFNKKVLAVAFAAAFSQSAFAVVDLDAETGDITIATETYSSSDLDSDGRLEVTNAGNILDLQAEAGFTVAASTSKYVRVDLTNAVFGAAPTLDTDSLLGTFAASLSQGGAAGDAYAIWEISNAAADIDQSDVFTVEVATVKVDDGTTAVYQYRLFETAAGAVNELESDLLVDESADAVSFASANDGDFVTLDAAVATVASEFMNFEDNSGDPATADYSTSTVARLGWLNVDDALVAGSYTPAGVAVTVADIIDADQTLTFSGDFSYGTWTLNDTNDCTGGTTAWTTEEDDTLEIENFDATDLASATGTSQAYLCVTVDGTSDVIQKTATPITVELSDDDMSGDSGEVTYDTTTIVLPYLTTYGDYNQRVYIVNNGSTDAYYTTTFVTEDGTTATAGDDATGTVAAGEMTMIKATNLVTLDGATRTYAEIEIEAPVDAIEATTQVVNTKEGDGGTDTLVLEVK